MAAVRALTICGKLKYNKELEIIIIYFFAKIWWGTLSQDFMGLSEHSYTIK